MDGPILDHVPRLAVEDCNEERVLARTRGQRMGEGNVQGHQRHKSHAASTIVLSDVTDAKCIFPFFEPLFIVNGGGLVSEYVKMKAAEIVGLFL